MTFILCGSILPESGGCQYLIREDLECTMRAYFLVANKKWAKDVDGFLILDGKDKLIAEMLCSELFYELYSVHKESMEDPSKSLVFLRCGTTWPNTPKHYDSTTPTYYGPFFVTKVTVQALSDDSQKLLNTALELAQGPIMNRDFFDFSNLEALAKKKDELEHILKVSRYLFKTEVAPTWASLVRHLPRPALEQKDPQIKKASSSLNPPTPTQVLTLPAMPPSPKFFPTSVSTNVEQKSATIEETPLAVHSSPLTVDSNLGAKAPGPMLTETSPRWSNNDFW